MSDTSFKHKVRSVHNAFDVARSTLGLNATAYVLNRDWKAQAAITSRLMEMGQTKLINLTHKYTDSAIAIPFYSGDGIVTKIMRESDYDKSNPVYNLPAISSDRVNTELDNFIINTYPWIPGGYVSRDDIEELRTKMQSVGLDFTTNDDHPRNIHIMPDENHTLIGIDASMYTTARNDKIQSPELEAAWKKYIETIFPIYKEEKVPAQTPETNFQFRSIHDRESGIIGFNSTRFIEEGKDPILRATEKLSSESRSIWNMLFPWGRKKEADELDSFEPT